MSAPTVLDAYCGAGGATRGYQEAGFVVHGVDVADQPRYVGERFFRGDAIEYIERWGHLYDFIHASPPCQAYSVARNLLRLRADLRGDYPDLVAATRDALRASGQPYVIENVPGAPLLNPIRLCGSMFGLAVRRHRLFESNLLLFSLNCDHDSQPARFPPANPNRVNPMRVISVVGHSGIQPGVTAAMRAAAMGIDWMTNSELSQSIPPAYTKHLGEQVCWHLEGEAA